MSYAMEIIKDENSGINYGHDSACMGLFMAGDGVKSFMTGLLTRQISTYSLRFGK
jgi:hypothetical protein